MPDQACLDLPSALSEAQLREFRRAAMRHVLAASLGLTQLGLGPQVHGASVDGLWTVELESLMEPPIAVGIAHWGERCRAALVVMPRALSDAPVSFCMPADDVVRAAEKQLRYVPLLGPASTPSPACAFSIQYRVESWAQDRCVTLSFVSPSRGPLRTLATTLHQLVDHVARGTGASRDVHAFSRPDPLSAAAE